MHTAINGWTKYKMIQQIRKRNNGKRAIESERNGYAADLCAYRASDGNACAVGCFIPHELYSDLFEGAHVTDILTDSPLLCEHMPLKLEALVGLQKIHDEHGDSGDVREALSDWIEKNVQDPVDSPPKLA